MAYRSRYASPSVAPRARTSRWRIFLPSVALLVLFLGLGCFWAYAAWRTGTAVDAWLAREARLGRNWTCPDRQISGFPFRLEVSCDKPGFTGKAGGRALTGELARVHAVAQLQDPNHVIVEAEGPLVVSDDAGGRLALQWDLLHGSIEGQGSAPLAQLAVEATKPRLTLVGFGLAGLEASGDSVDFHMRRTPSRPVEDNAYDVASRATQLRLPPADQWLGDQAPIDMDAVATVTQAEPLTGAPPAAELERWRAAGGKVQLSKLMLAKGAKRLDATGVVGLDDLRRPQGRLDISVAGLDDLLQQFGLSPRAANIGGLIAGVLGGRAPKAPEPDASGTPGGVVLPLRLDNGKAFLGPLAVARLMPLY
jgi:hypothetical protein